MKVLIDANLLRRAFVHGLEGHDVRSAQWEGLAAYENGDLQMEAERRGFGVLVTKDEDMPVEEASQGRPDPRLPVIVLPVGNDMAWLVGTGIPKVRRLIETGQLSKEYIRISESAHSPPP